ESGVVQSYSFDSYQLEEEEAGRDPQPGVLALSQPGEGHLHSLFVCRSSCLHSSSSSSLPAQTARRRSPTTVTMASTLRCCWPGWASCSPTTASSPTSTTCTTNSK
ncbi:unnamed protein product, partial [Tetraodon nigroviridis]